MRNINFAFYVSGKATRFQKFIETAGMELVKQIKLVFSDDDSNAFLKERMDNLGITYVLQKYDELPQNRNLLLSNALLKQLEKHDVDYCFSFGDHILKGELLQVYKNRIINFHPSILPMYPGRKAIDQAVQDDKAFLIGNTAHFIDEGMDTGKIIMQSVMAVERFRHGGYDAILDTQVEMLQKLFVIIKEGRLHMLGDEPIIEGANYLNYHIYPQI